MSITPEQLAASGTEQGHQVAVMQWAALHLNRWPELKWLFHVPNGGSRNKIEAARLKAAGVKSGVSDLCLPVRRGCHCGLFIEMKRPKERATREQLEFGQFVVDQGYFFAVCDSWEKAADVLKKYLKSVK